MISRVIKCIETESRMNGGSQEVEGGGNEGSLFNWHRVLGLQCERGSGDGLHKIVNLRNTTELYT